MTTETTKTIEFNPRKRPVVLVTIHVRDLGSDKPYEERRVDKKHIPILKKIMEVKGVRSY